MKTRSKIFHIIVWSTLTLAVFNLRAAKEPLYDGLGSYSRKVTTDSAEAQRYFDQGLTRAKHKVFFSSSFQASSASGAGTAMALKYDEPPGWMIPVRHSLGAVLMKQQRFAEAEQVYRDDLARLPKNGWSLLGLAESLRKQKKNPDEVARIQAKFEKVWAKADLMIISSCLCQPKA